VNASASCVVPNKLSEPKMHCIVLTAFVGNRGLAVSLSGMTYLVLFMVALCNRADHIYFHPVSFFFFLFFPRLISAVGDWMFTILWHMVWP